MSIYHLINIKVRIHSFPYRTDFHERHHLHARGDTGRMCFVCVQWILLQAVFARKSLFRIAAKFSQTVHQGRAITAVRDLAYHLCRKRRSDPKFFHVIPADSSVHGFIVQCATRRPLHFLIKPSPLLRPVHGRRQHFVLRFYGYEYPLQLCFGFAPECRTVAKRTLEPPAF